MGPAELGQALQGLQTFHDPRLLVGYEGFSDASVYELDGGQLLVQTLDFFTPVVDDPRHFGRIAAANSLSDVYAMGATPLTALNIAAFPKNLGMDILNQIFRGGMEKAAEAGIAIAGGHTVDDPEPKYGLAVTGLVARDRLVRNCNARPGDVILLTKPLGIGALTTALKRGDMTEADLAEAIALMEQLNAGASRLLHPHGCRAATDVTGFGFLGHLWEMCQASGVRAVVEAAAVPVLAEALPLTREWRMPGGSIANMEYLQDKIELAGAPDPAILAALHDAQTSGGLIIAAPPERAGALLAELTAEYPWSRAVGHFESGAGILVRP